MALHRCPGSQGMGEWLCIGVQEVNEGGMALHRCPGSQGRGEWLCIGFQEVKEWENGYA